MAFTNRLRKIIDKFQSLPASWRMPAFTFAFGRVVPFMATAKIKILSISEEEAHLYLKNRRPVQNHIKGVHASAMNLLAETATGLMVGYNLPDSALPLMKSMKVKFTARAEGDLHAHARLTGEQIERMRNDPKGEVLVAVSITDETGKEPIQCEMIWAWVKAKR